MLDRVGSNLDRAVLLGDLLRRAGHTVRLAHAEIPDKLARDLLGKVRPMPDRRISTIAPGSPSAERRQAMEAILPGFGESLQEARTDALRRAKDAEALVRSQADQLHAAVREVATRDSTEDTEAIAALRDHWWVERREADEWIAMDVLLPDARLGEAITGAAQTYAWSKEAVAPPIPESDWHSVGVRVVVERFASGATTEATVLETELRPAEVFDRPVMLTHIPKPWPERLPDPKTSPNALGDAAVQVKEWVPLLQVGDAAVAQSGFTESGDLIKAPLDPKRDVAAAGGGGFMSGFGEALGGGESASTSYVTAEWLDYEIHVPGEPSELLRRPVFDLLGPANRKARIETFDASTNDRLVERYEALLSRTDILLQPCDLTGDFVAYLAASSIIANQAAIKELSRERDQEKARILASTILERLDSWGALPALALWRSTLAEDPKDWFINRPNVLNYRITLPVVNRDQVSFRETIDIASNATGVRRRAGRSAFDVRLRQGVADTVAELAALGSEISGAQNTAAVFAKADTESSYGLLIGRNGTGSVQELGWPEDVAARLVANVDAGSVVVAVPKPVSILGRPRVGWWRIDPESGETIGVMDTGLHEDTADYSLIQLQVSFLRAFLVLHAGAIAAARAQPVLTMGQSLLLRAANAAEAAISLANRPFF
jgi:hypothetical protein